MLIRALILLSLLALTSCSDPLTQFVNAKWPAVDAKSQRQVAIDTTATALSTLTAPNLALGVNLSDLGKALQTTEIKSKGITRVSVRGEEQLLVIGLDFSKTFDEKDGGTDSALRKILAETRPQVSGSVTVYAGLAGALSQRDPPKLELKILPAIETVSVTKIILADKYDVSGIGEALAALLNKFKDNIAGEIGKSSITSMTLPAIAKSSLDVSKTFKITNSDVSATIDVKGNPISPPFKVAGVAWLVTEDELLSLVQLVPLSGASLTPTVRIGNTYKEIHDQMVSLAESQFGMSTTDDLTWVAIRKDLTAATLNNVVAQASLCIGINGESNKQSASSQIDLPNGAQISCDSDRDCSPKGDCNFKPNEDHRDCSTCIIPRPRVCSPRVCAFGGCVGGGCVGGGCAQMGNNPVCALAQGVQNDAYRADAAAKKVDCERLKSTEKLTCEAEKAGAKGLCEAGKEALNRIAATGKFANLDVESTMKANNLRVCLRDFALASTLDNVQFSLDVQGSAGADVDLKFVPLDIVGHLTCQFPWTESKHFNASLRESLPVSAKISLFESGGEAQAKFDIAETTIKAHLSPTPTEFLLTSTNMTLACAGMNMVKPLVVVLTPFIPTLKGDIEHKLKTQNAALKLDLPSQTVGDKSFNLTATVTKPAFVVFAKMKPE